MRFSLLALTAAAMLLTACGGMRESRMNPANWFGRSTSTAVEPGMVVTADGQVEEVNPLIGERKQSQISSKKARRAQAGAFTSIFDREEGPYAGTLVDQVTDLNIERTATGAIVRVTGTSARQGAFDVRLVPTNEGVPIDGVLTYELRALQPLNTLQGPPRSRVIKAGAPLTVVTIVG